MPKLSIVSNQESLEVIDSTPQSMLLLTPDVVGFLTYLTDSHTMVHGQLPLDYPDHAGESVDLLPGYHCRYDPIDVNIWDLMIGPNFKSKITRQPMSDGQLIDRLQVANPSSTESQYIDAKAAEVMKVRVLLGQIVANTALY